MDERILKWLFDIKMAIEEIEGYFKNDEKDFFQYRENLMLKKGCGAKSGDNRISNESNPKSRFKFWQQNNECKIHCWSTKPSHTCLR